MRPKNIVTLAMLWIGIMVFIQTPQWLAAARDFVSRSSGHATPATAPGGSTAGLK